MTQTSLDRPNAAERRFEEYLEAIACGQIGKQDNCQVAVSLSVANAVANDHAS